MRKTLLILIIQNLFQHLCFAQVDTLKTKLNYKMIISIAGGTATPEGVFGRFENDHTPYIFEGGNIAGGASNGYYGKLDFSYLIHKHFGATAMLYSSSNSRKELTPQEFKEPFSYAMGGGFRVTSYTHDTKEWYTNGALIGIYTETGNKFIALDFKFSIGIQQVKSPEAHIYEEGYNWMGGVGKTGTYSQVETQPSLISYNVVGNLGIDFSYRFAKRFKARIGIENFFSQAEFDGNITFATDTNYTNGTTGHNEYQQKLHFTKNVFIFGLNVGISYVIK